MLTIGLKYALRERTRFLLTALGLTCAVVLTVFLVGVYRGSLHGSLSYIENADVEIWVGRQGAWNLMRSSGMLPEGTLEAVLAVDGVESAEPILRALLPAESGDLKRTLLVIGLDVGAKSGRPVNLHQGEGMPGHGEIIVDQAYAARAGITRGDTLELAGRLMEVIGISRDTNMIVAQYAFLSRPELNELLGLSDQASFLLVKTNPARASEIATRLEKEVSGVSAIDRNTFLANNRDEMEAGLLPVLWTIAILGIVVGGIVIALMTYTAVLEKRNDYVLLRAIGADGWIQTSIVLQQAILAAIIGGLAGLVVLVVLEQYLPRLIPELEFRFELWIGFVALAGSIVMAIIGALVPAWVATRLSPMEAFRR